MVTGGAGRAPGGWGRAPRERGVPVGCYRLLPQTRGTQERGAGLRLLGGTNPRIQSTYWVLPDLTEVFLTTAT